jgi:hypothetical protein
VAVEAASDRLPAAVARAVEEAVVKTAPSEELPTWESVVERIAEVYAAVGGERPLASTDRVRE